MKKLLLLAVVAAVAVGCSSSGKKDTNQNNAATYSKYQIVDQEFDNMIAPESDYDRVAPYEDQLGTSSYIQTAQKGARKPGAKRTVEPKKVVTDGQGNLISEPSMADVKDTEALPDTGSAQ